MLSVTLALGIGATVAQLAQPLTVGAVIDAIQDGRSVWRPVLLLVVLFAADAGLSGFQGYLLGRTGEGIVLDLRRTLIGRLIRLPVYVHDRFRTGDLLSRVTADTVLLRTALTSSLTQAVAGLLTFAGAVTLMALLDPVLLTVALVCVLAAAAVVLAVSGRVRAASEEAQESLGRLSSALERALGAIRTVKLSGAEERETGAVSGEARAAYDAGVRAVKLQAVVEPATFVAVQAAFVLVLGVGGARLAAGQLQVSDLVAFLLYLAYLVGPLVMVFMSLTDLQQGLAAVGRIDEVLDSPAEPADEVSPPRTSRDDDAAVRLENVAFGYAPERQILSGVSFAAAPFALTALVGPSGAGKSTVFALLARFYDADSGRVELDGTDVRELPLKTLRRELGYVEQDSPVLAGTVRQNLLYAEPDATEEQLDEVLDLTNLRSLVERMPLGLDTEVGDGGVLLSGGERQRIAIARMLLTRPKVLLLDEITSQLDAKNEVALRQTVARLTERCAVMVIAHRLSTVADADRIVVLDDGRVSGTGTHETLVHSNPLYRELATSQLIEAQSAS